MSKLNLQHFLGVLYSFKGMQTSRIFPASTRRIRTLGAQTSDADTHLAFCRALIMTYTAGWVLFIENRLILLCSLERRVFLLHRKFFKTAPPSSSAYSEVRRQRSALIHRFVCWKKHHGFAAAREGSRGEELRNVKGHGLQSDVDS